MISISLTGHQHMQFVLVHVVKNTVVLDHIRSIWTRSSGLVKPKFNARLWSSVRMLCLFFFVYTPCILQGFKPYRPLSYPELAVSISETLWPLFCVISLFF